MIEIKAKVTALTTKRSTWTKWATLDEKARGDINDQWVLIDTIMVHRCQHSNFMNIQFSCSFERNSVWIIRSTITTKFGFWPLWGVKRSSEVIQANWDYRIPGFTESICSPMSIQRNNQTRAEISPRLHYSNWAAILLHINYVS